MQIDNYRPIVGDSVIDELLLIAKHLEGRVVKNINSTAVGGGVAEILNRMVPLLNELGVHAKWDVIRGGNDFFNVTKKIHNALQGAPGDFTTKDRDTYFEAQEDNLKMIDLDADILFIHDPQPAGLIKKKAEMGRRWVWRCHIDLSNPNPSVWEFQTECAGAGRS
jgi:trehalose synthase